MLTERPVAAHHVSARIHPSPRPGCAPRCRSHSTHRTLAPRSKCPLTIPLCSSAAGVPSGSAQRACAVSYAGCLYADLCTCHEAGPCSYDRLRPCCIPNLPHLDPANDRCTHLSSPLPRHTACALVSPHIRMSSPSHLLSASPCHAPPTPMLQGGALRLHSSRRLQLPAIPDPQQFARARGLTQGGRRAVLVAYHLLTGALETARPLRAGCDSVAGGDSG